MTPVDYEYYVKFPIHLARLYSPKSQMYLGITSANWNKKTDRRSYGKFSVTQSLLLLFHRSSQWTLIITFDLQSWIMDHIASYCYHDHDF